MRQRPPMRLRGVVQRRPLFLRAGDQPKTAAYPNLWRCICWFRMGGNHKVSLRRRVQSWESLGSGRAAVEPPYYRTPPLIGVKTGTSFVRRGKSESLKT